MFAQDIPATALPHKEKETKIKATSGLKCTESLAKFSHIGTWVKTFSGLLINQKGWHSNKCKLVWKLRGTRFGRMYFQLVPIILPAKDNAVSLLPTPTTQESTHPQAELTPTNRRLSANGNSHSLNLADTLTMGLLPTPNASDTYNANNKNDHDVKRGYLRGYATMGLLPTPLAIQRDHPERVAALMATGAETVNSRKNGDQRPGSIVDFLMFNKIIPTPATAENKQINGLLPTPVVMDTNCGDLEKIDQRRAKSKAKGINGNGFGVTLGELANRSLLPTPTVSDAKNTSLPPSQVNRNGSIVKKILDVDALAGQSSHLNPQFVAEMMGYPPDYLEIPFLAEKKLRYK